MHDGDETRPATDQMAVRLDELEREVARLTEGDAGSLARRVRELEAQVDELTAPLAPAPRRSPLSGARPTRTTNARSRPPAARPGAAQPGPSRPQAPSSPADVPVDRRRVLGRAGTAALGAVLGGTALSVANASPASAATGTFDSDDGTPALTATNTGSGSAILATTTGTASNTAVEIHSAGTGISIVATGNGSALDITQESVSQGFAVSVDATETAVGVFSSGRQYGVLGLAEDPSGFAIGGWASGAAAGVEGFGSEGSDGGQFTSNLGFGVVAAGGRAQLLLHGPPGDEPSMAPPGTRTDEHIAGELYLDDTQSLWLCTAAGTPGTWVRITGAGTAGPLSMLPAPVRVYDTRPGAAPTGVGPKTPLATAVPRTGIALTANGSTVAADATAAIVSITVTNTTGGSPAGPAYLGIYADGASYAGTSNLNWTAPGSTIAVTTTTAVGPGATIAAFASHPTDLIIDVIAYYR
jgi:hypothetical protein